MTEDFKRTLSNGWRVSEPYSVSRDDNKYAKEMAAELNAIPKKKIPPTKTQSLMTQALLDAQKDRPLWQDEEYIRIKKESPIDPAAQVRDAEGNVVIGDRAVDVNLVEISERNRRSQKNTLGQSDVGSVDADKRDRGIQALTYSKPYDPSDSELLRLKKVNAVNSNEVAIPDFAKAEPPQMTWKERFRLRFNEIFGDFLYK